MIRKPGPAAASLGSKRLLTDWTEQPRAYHFDRRAADLQRVADLHWRSTRWPALRLHGQFLPLADDGIHDNFIFNSAF